MASVILCQQKYRYQKKRN